jgi:hypothetical protein
MANGLQRLDDHRPARARHPHAIVLDGGVQFAAVFVLEDEGFEGGAEGGGHLPAHTKPTASQEMAALVEHGLFDYLAGAREDRDRQAERLGGLEIDDQLVFGGLLHRQAGWFGPLEDLDVISTLASCPA